VARIANRAVVGVSDHCGWAVSMTVAADGTLLDRRRMELVGPGLPSLPHHHDAQGLPLAEGVALVERVRASADEHASAGLAALAADLDVAVTTIALRRCPSLPPTIAERIASYAAQTKADSVMFREALAAAAQARGWSVVWYDPKTVFTEAARALHVERIDGLLRELGASLGPPWRTDHRMALAAALAVTRPGRSDSS
jgi:hypothetical protein